CYEWNEATDEIYAVEDWWDAPPMRATGFLKSTVRDMMRYAQLYMNQGLVDNQNILSKESIEEMLTPHIKMDPEKMYGYGFSVTEDYHGTTMIDHGGSLQSISSKFAILPDEGVSAIVLTNLADFPAGRLLLMALNAYYGRSLDADHLGFEAIELSPEIFASYTGEYISDEGMDCVLRFSDQGDFEFFYRGRSYPITFVQENVFTAWIDATAEPIELLKDIMNDYNKERNEMKIYIMADGEGISGVVHSSEMHQSGERHDEFRKLMTKDVNAAIEGAFQGGATEVVVNDAHWSMLNIIYEDLDERVEIIRGGNKRDSMMEQVAGFDGALYIGLHAKVGHSHGVANETLIGPAMHEMRMNGHPVGELEMNAAI